MAPSWLNIRRVRPDLMDYVIHWTSSFDILRKIVACGYLRPSFAQKHRSTVGGRQNTINGPDPAVCFTEQPLDAFIKSCHMLPDRYQPYGVILHKWHLYTYGGRPVVYGDENLLKSLPADHKYLWVRYSPIPDEGFGGYPVDWTHEREWRAKQSPYHYLEVGTTPSEGVPLLLPPVYYPVSKRHILCLPRFLVKTKVEAQELKEWIRGLPPYEGDNGFLRHYFQLLPRSMIIPLEEVEKRLGEGDMRWARLEALPYKELDPSFKMPTPESYL